MAIVQDIWKGGVLRLKVSGIFSRWEKRSFAVMRNGHVSWGPMTVSEVEWETRRIESLSVSDVSKVPSDFSFTINLKDHKMLLVRAADEGQWVTWVRYVAAVVAQLPREEQKEETNHSNNAEQQSNHHPGRMFVRSSSEMLSEKSSSAVLPTMQMYLQRNRSVQ
uniref:PH domain-containing protein n=1 Tax=Lotharella globosa TaxID=91324 RepID=A0A7S3Z028_9EUKA